MQSINQTSGQELIFEPRPKGHHQFDLLAGTEPIASLLWQKGSGTLAQADAAEGSWTFKRSGFWHPKISIRQTGTETDFAVFEASWSGKGNLTFQNGVTYRFESNGFWHRDWNWLDADGNQLIHFESKQGWTRFKGQVTIEPATSIGPDLPLLVLFGWYLIVLMSEDASNAAIMGGVTAATSASITSSH